MPEPATSIADFFRELSRRPIVAILGVCLAAAQVGCSSHTSPSQRRPQSASAPDSAHSAAVSDSASREARASATSPIPLDQGTRWDYTGTIQWTDSTKNMHFYELKWTMAVDAATTGPRARAAVVHGFLSDVIFSESGRKPGYSVFLSVGDSLIMVPAASAEVATQLARQLADRPETLPASAVLLLDMPLVAGKKWGQASEGRNDDMYCWIVESEEMHVLAVEGVDRAHPLRVISVAYRTLPDGTEMDIVPGVGITAYSYMHYGTVMSVQLRLVAFRPRR